RGDLRERRGAWRPNLDADGVTGDEVRLGDDSRHSVRPAQELRVRIDGEVLVVAEADQLLERKSVATEDVHVERRRVAGVGKQVAVEDECRLAASLRGEGARRAGREHDERGDEHVGEAPSHPETSW